MGSLCGGWKRGAGGRGGGGHPVHPGSAPAVSSMSPHCSPQGPQSPFPRAVSASHPLPRSRLAPAGAGGAGAEPTGGTWQRSASAVLSTGSATASGSAGTAGSGGPAPGMQRLSIPLVPKAATSEITRHGAAGGWGRGEGMPHIGETAPRSRCCRTPGGAGPVTRGAGLSGAGFGRAPAAGDGPAALSQRVCPVRRSLPLDAAATAGVCHPGGLGAAGGAPTPREERRGRQAGEGP